MAQMGFFDLSDRYASLDAKMDPLVEIDAVVHWEEFSPILERVSRKPDAERKSRAGRKWIRDQPRNAAVLVAAVRTHATTALVRRQSRLSRMTV
jgi:hypothetical protein